MWWFWWWLFGALHDLVESDVYGMLRRDPVDLQEQRGHRDGDIAEHEDREGKQVRHQTPLLSAVNVLVLKDGREQRQGKEGLVHHRERHDKRGGTSLHLDLGGQETMRKPAHDEEGRVGEHGDQGQQHARSDGHKHVIGGKAMVAERRFDKMLAIGKKDLVEALGPAHTLLPRGLKRHGLLVKELRRRIADANTVNSAERGELDILGQRMELPPVHAFDNARGDEVARTRDGAGRLAGTTWR